MTNQPNSEVFEAVSDFYRIAGELAEFGASDTEPRGVFADVFEAAIVGHEFAIPRKAWSDRWDERSWQLYSGMKGNAQAAAKLAAATRKVVKLTKANREDAIDAYRWYFGYTPAGVW